MTDEARTRELEDRIAQLELRIARSDSRGDGRSAAETAFWAIMHNVFPEDARRHLKVAGREQLMAARVYLDRWIAKLDESSSGMDGATAPEAESIEIK